MKVFDVYQKSSNNLNSKVVFMRCGVHPMFFFFWPSILFFGEEGPILFFICAIYIFIGWPNAFAASIIVSTLSALFAEDIRRKLLQLRGYELITTLMAEDTKKARIAFYD